MPKAKVNYVWNAVCKLELRNLALSVGYDVLKRGGREVRVFKAQDWLDDGKVMIDVGKRLRGWFVQQARTVKPSLADALKYGLKCDSIPKPGLVQVGVIKDIQKNDDFPEKDKQEYYLPTELEKIGYPIKNVFSINEKGTKRSVFTFNYVIEKPMQVEAKIYSFARGFMPESAKEMLNELGLIMGLGDKYSSGYGAFKLLEFKHEIKELNI